jgi:hypothetical protein
MAYGPTNLGVTISTNQGTKNRNRSPSFLATGGAGAWHVPMRGLCMLLGTLLGTAHVTGSATPSVRAPEHDTFMY